MSSQWSDTNRARRISERLKAQLAVCEDGWRRKTDGRFDRHKHADGHLHWNGQRFTFTKSKSKEKK